MNPLSRYASALFAFSALVACGQSLPSEEDGRYAETQLPIINGTVDTAHPAVVRHESKGFCSATIVKVEGSTGYALTAAHCIDSKVLGALKQGQDANQPDRVYNITKNAVHPDYKKASAFDFAMVTFEGADANTPVLPILEPSKDTYKPGLMLTFVGYGVVKQGPGGDNSERRVIQNKIESLSALRFVFDQTEKGFCSGDSGGPGLTAQQPERVAAVIQAVTGGNGGCSDQGFAGRLSTVYDTFVGPYLDGTPYKLQSCDVCREAVTTSQSACLGLISDCFNNAKCLGYAQCLQQCTTQACADDCASQHPDGATMYGQIGICSCQQCASECEGEPQCQEEPPPMTTSSTASSSSSTAGAGGAMTAAATAGVGGSGGMAGGDSESEPQQPTEQSGCSLTKPSPRAPQSRAALVLAMLAFASLSRRRQNKPR